MTEKNVDEQLQGRDIRVIMRKPPKDEPPKVTERKDRMLKQMLAYMFSEDDK